MNDLFNEPVQNSTRNTCSTTSDNKQQKVRPTKSNLFKFFTTGSTSPSATPLKENNRHRNNNKGINNIMQLKFVLFYHTI